MKNLVILGLASLLLFSVSFGLSMWLKQSKDDATKAEAKETKKEPEKKEPEKKAEKDDHAKPAEKADASHGDTSEAVRREREKVQQRTERIELVLKDAREVQDTHDRLAKQVLAESKAAVERNIELDNRTATLQKQKDDLEKVAADAKKAPTTAEVKKAQQEADAAEAKNLDKMATLVEAMPADKAALQLQDLANSGKLDTAVKLLGRMKERQAAKVLAEITDIALAGQLLDKMRTARPVTDK